MNSSNRKIRPQPALASLTDDEREQIADWLRCQTFAQVQARIAKTREEGGFDLRVSISVLQRLLERTATLQQVNDQLEDKQNLADLLAAQNGEQVDWAKGTYELVQRAAFKIALLPDQTPARLISLLRLADHPRQVANDEHKKQIAERNTAVRESQLNLARGRGTFHPCPTTIPPTTAENSTLSTGAQSAPASNHPAVDSALPAPSENSQFLIPDSEGMNRPCDHLGPLARNWEDVRERARKAFHITPEESARRAELRRTWKDPNIELNAACSAQSPTSAPRPLNIIDLLKEITPPGKVEEMVALTDGG